MPHTTEDAPRASSDGTEDAVARVRAFLDACDREAEAAKILRAADTRPDGYHFYISGNDILGDETVSRIENPSSLVQVSRVTSLVSFQVLSDALHPRFTHNAPLLMTLFRRVRFELYICESVTRELGDAIEFAKRLSSLLQLKTGCLIGLVSVSTVPLSQIAAHTGDVLITTPFGLDSKQPLWKAEHSASRQDLDWSLLRMLRCGNLYEKDPSFRLAFDAASDSPFSSDSRAAIARIWSGIESLFDVQSELSYRLSMYAAALLSDDLSDRVKVQREFKRLYNLRSKAVHGAKMTDDAVSKALIESWQMLCSLLIACIEIGPKIPDPATLDAVLLGASLNRDGGIEYPTIG